VPFQAIGANAHRRLIVTRRRVLCFPYDSHCGKKSGDPQKRLKHARQAKVQNKSEKKAKNANQIFQKRQKRVKGKKRFFFKMIRAFLFSLKNSQNIWRKLAILLNKMPDGFFYIGIPLCVKFDQARGQRGNDLRQFFLLRMSDFGFNKGFFPANRAKWASLEGNKIERKAQKKGR